MLIRENLPEELGIVTVTDTAVTPDFKQAKIYITLINKDTKKQVLEKLVKKTPDFQHFLGKNLKMRSTPRLTFVIDESEGKVDRVEELLKRLNPDKVGVARPQPGHREIDRRSN